MNDLTLPEIAYRLYYIGIIHHPQDIIIRCFCFLLRSHIFHEVGDGVAFDCEGKRIERESCSGLRVYTCGMIYEIRFKARFLDLIYGHVSCELMDYG